MNLTYRELSIWEVYLKVIWENCQQSLKLKINIIKVPSVICAAEYSHKC